MLGTCVIRIMMYKVLHPVCKTVPLLSDRSWVQLLLPNRRRSRITIFEKYLNQGSMFGWLQWQVLNLQYESLAHWYLIAAYGFSKAKKILPLRTEDLSTKSWDPESLRAPKLIIAMGRQWHPRQLSRKQVGYSKEQNPCAIKSVWSWIDIMTSELIPKRCNQHKRKMVFQHFKL